MKVDNINKLIGFLETLEEENFFRGLQTKDRNKENIGVSHCLIGHIYVNPNSPFHNKEYVNEQGMFTTLILKDNGDYEDAFEFIEKDFGIEYKVSNLFADINNYAPEGKIKETVVNHLKDLIK